LKKIIMLVFAWMLVFGTGLAMAENVNVRDFVRPEVDIRVTGDAVGLAGGITTTSFAYDLLSCDLKYVVMVNDKLDNKLQLGLNLNTLKVADEILGTDYGSENLFLSIGLGLDILDNLNVKYIAAFGWKF